MVMELSILEEKLGISFKNKDLLKTALTHRSYLNEHPNFPLPHNERLEFLGDAVLEFVVSEYLYKNLKKPEGEMTELRAALVNSKTLSRVAREIGIWKYMNLSKGEEKNTERAKDTILANALEAIIGAIYLDQGIEKVKEFVEKNILKYLPELLEKKSIKDPKTMFQEITQEKMGITPEYKILKEWGPDHRKEFLAGVYLKEKLIATGHGFSKKEAEEMAAQKAIKIIKKE